jgi:hypothetical protein
MVGQGGLTRPPVAEWRRKHGNSRSKESVASDFDNQAFESFHGVGKASAMAGGDVWSCVISGMPVPPRFRIYPSLFRLMSDLSGPGPPTREP